MFAALTNFLNKSLAADNEGRENKCGGRLSSISGVVFIAIIYCCVLAYTGLRFCSKRQMESQSCGSRRTNFTRNRLKTLKWTTHHCSASCVGQLVAATGTYVVCLSEELVMDEESQELVVV